MFVWVSPVSQASRHPALSLSLIIPVYRGGEDFRRCLAGIAQLAPPADEVIVVVDGDDDGSGEAAAAAGAKLVRLPGHFGPATARNAGVRASSGELLLFIDADTVPATSVVGQVRAAFDADPGLAALIGSYDDAPGASSFLSQYRNLLHHYIHQTADRRAHTFWGGCGAVRREVFFGVGGFDEAYAIPAMEDVELGYRLARAGHRIQLHKDLQVKHLKRWDALNLLRTDIFQRAIPWSRLLRREGRIPNDLNLRRDSRLSAALVWVGLAALAAAPAWPPALYAAGLAGAALLGLNAPLYRFFQRQRGWRFALRTVPWHWLYYLYGSAAFAYVWLVEHHHRAPPPRRMGEASNTSPPHGQ
jgi:GT2 family glycosyltransferase